MTGRTPNMPDTPAVPTLDVDADERAGWIPVEGVGEPAERLELADIELLTETTHPIRGRLLRRMKQPRTVAELATLLDVPVTRLYHHVNRLDELGLIHIVATRRVAAVTERRYQVVAESFHVSPDLLERSDDRSMAQALGSLFDAAKLGLQKEIESGAHRRLGGIRDHSVLSLGERRLTAARREELIARFEALVSEFVSDADDDDPDAATMVLFVAAYPQSD